MTKPTLRQSIEANKEQLQTRIHTDEYFIHCHWASQRTLVSFIPPTAHRILDIGCGPGSAGLTAFLQDMDYVGIDFVHEYLADVQRQHMEKGPFSFSGRRCLQFPMETLPFANNSFDVVYSRHVIEHSLDLAQTLQEIRRVLKLGGLFIFCVPARVDDIEPTHMMRWSARRWLQAFRQVGPIRFHAQHDYFIDELYGYAEKPDGVQPHIIQRFNKYLGYWMGQGYVSVNIVKTIWQIEAFVTRLLKHD